MKNREKETEKKAIFNVIDKRKFVNPDAGDADSIPEETPRYPSYVEELVAKMKETERRFQEKKKQMDEEIARVRMRLEADCEQRMEEERRKLALPFLEVIDNLERAVVASKKHTSVEDLRKGVEMTAHLFHAKLRNIGVEAISSMGMPFNPNCAQAVGMVPVCEACKDGVVVEELQIGYTMRGQLLRPAQVRVGRMIR